MSVVVATEGLLLSALQPSTSVTTYAIPTDDHPRRDQLSKARRVQQQVQQRMAEKCSSSPRLNASTGEQNLFFFFFFAKIRNIQTQGTRHEYIPRWAEPVDDPL